MGKMDVPSAASQPESDKILRSLPTDTVLSQSNSNLSSVLTALAHSLGKLESRLGEHPSQVLIQAIEQSPVSVLITDVSGRIEYANPAFSQLSGYRLEEVLGQNPRLLKSGHTSDEEYRHLWETICSGGVWSGEFHNRHKDGHGYWIEATIGPLMDETGAISHFMGAQVAIDRRKEAEAALMESETLLKLILRSIHEVVFTVSDEGEITQVFGELPFGSNRYPSTLKELFRSQEMALHYGALRKALAGQRQIYEWTYRIDGNDQTYQITLTPFMRLSSSDDLALLGTIKNITREHRLHQEEKNRFYIERTISRISSRFTRYQEFHKAVYLSLRDLGMLLQADAIYFAGYNGSHILIHPEHLWMNVKRPDYLRYPVFMPMDHHQDFLDKIQQASGLCYFEELSRLSGEIKASVRELCFTDPESLLIVPVNLGDAAYGFIAAESPKNQFLKTQRRSDFLHFAGKIFAHGLERFAAMSDIESQSHELHRKVTVLTKIIGSLQVAVLLLDQATGKVVETNQSARELLGYPAEELCQIYFPDLLLGNGDKSHFDHDLAEPLYNTECVLLTSTGVRIPILLNMVPIPLNEEKVVVTSIVDMRSSKKQEDAVQVLHKQNKQLLNSISSILIGVDSDDKISHFNRVAAQTFGIAADEIIGQPVLACPIPWDWMKIIEVISECREKNQPVPINDFKYRRTDGKDGFLNLVINPYVDENPVLSGFLIMGEEVTERKMLESQLSHAQKMESIGQLAAGIAHEINTPTQYIGDNTYFLQEAFEDINKFLNRVLDKSSENEPSIESLKELAGELDLEYLSGEIPNAIKQTLEGVQRVTKIVRAMKEFSHPGVEEKMPIDLNKSLENTLTVARNEWKYVADTETQFDPELPLVYCLPGELNQVFLNIIVNSAHAIAEVVGDGSEEKGKITISTRRRGSDWVEIRIADTGAGIPKEIQDRIFDPFFTTKEVGKGTGQGLSIAHGVVVKKHGGSIQFESEPGAGTTFIICLPVHGDDVKG